MMFRKKKTYVYSEKHLKYVSEIKVISTNSNKRAFKVRIFWWILEFGIQLNVLSSWSLCAQLSVTSNLLSHLTNLTQQKLENKKKIN
jgi:hypothetical protein